MRSLVFSADLTKSIVMTHLLQMIKLSVLSMCLVCSDTLLLLANQIVPMLSTLIFIGSGTLTPWTSIVDKET